METMVSSDNLYSRTLDALEEAGNLRTLSQQNIRENGSGRMASAC